ncbi:hypothetical protein KP509_01G045200 [Ceratopteris richardii]|uniref:SHSP domain-containing protein n=1 Tax=Ceratopteris richardii TaxID=49495 RepID=A0A8T2VGH0_CERRI|nr:hypothetical protein KP509_01G045200 [Ceratopteris richardii]
MALLLRKLHFLPFLSARRPGSPIAAYLASRTFASRRSSDRDSSVVNVSVDEDATTDEDEGTQENVEVLQVADEDDEVAGSWNDVMCRVTFPENRRAWAASQDENALTFRLDMPGVAKEDVKVYVDDTILVVKGKYAQPKEEIEDESHVLADNVGTYSAELYLPDNVQKDKIRSHMRDGMLLVTAPKQVIRVAIE